MFNTILFENQVIYQIMWKNTADPDIILMTIRRMRIECWIPKVTNTHSEYVIHFAVPLQRWLHERTQCYVIRTLPALLCLYCSALILFNAETDRDVEE
jgi:hypothetical protein